MSYTYLIDIESLDDLRGKNGIKTLHAVLSNVFEKCYTNWKKGEQYPAFKILRNISNKLLISTNIDLNEKSFGIIYGPNDNRLTKVSVSKTDFQHPYNFENGQKVIAFGRLSMYKSQNINNKRSKIALVRSCYPDKILDYDYFVSLLRRKTGINPIDIAVEPLYVPKSEVPKDKAINSAFDISIIGIVEDENSVNSLSYRSIGQDVSYGFGALDVREL